MRIATIGREMRRRFGPRLGLYLMLEIVLPGGTLLALLLFLAGRGNATSGSLGRELRPAPNPHAGP